MLDTFFHLYLFVEKQVGCGVAYVVDLSWFTKNYTNNIVIIKTSDMKNRILPSGLLTAFVGISFLLFSTVTFAGNTGKNRWERIRANQITGTVDIKDVMKAQQQLGDMRMKSTSALGLNWKSMGPDNYAGPAWSVLYDNTDQTGQRIYAGSANGGIWISSNNGLTWVAAPTAGNIVPKVSSLVQTPSGTIFAATGATTCGTYTSKGTGLYVSIGANPFSLVPGTLTNPDWTTCAKLAVNSTGRLFAATQGGLLYSDNGTDWSKALTGYATDVAIGSDGTVIASVDNKGYVAVGGNVSNFVCVSTGTATTLPVENVGWAQFAIAPSDANIMYASLAKPDGYMLNIYRSVDKGSTWSVIFPNNPTFEPFAGSGCKANTISVFPTDAFKIILGGVDMWFGEMIEPAGFYSWEQISVGSTSVFDPQFVPSMHHCYVFNPKSTGQFAIATDGGITIGTVGTQFFTFKTSLKNLQISRFNSVTTSYRKDFVMGGGDYIGTQNIGYYFPLLVNNPHDGVQVWVTSGATDEGGTGGSCAWSAIDPNVIIYSKVKAVSPELLVRRQDMRDITYGNDFLMGISNAMVDIIPMKLWESFDFTLNRDSVKFINKTTATIPANAAITAKSANISFPFQYVTPVAIPSGDSIMVPDYVATRFFIAGTRSGTTGVYMNKDALNFAKDPSYFMVMKDTIKNPISDPISCIGLSNDGNTAWVGTEKGRLCRISNLALAHDSATADYNSPKFIVSNEFFRSLPFAGQFVSSVSVNPNNAAQVLVTLGNYGNTNYLYYSSNALDSLPVFTTVQGNLPQIPVYSSIIEMHSSGNALIGTDFGVFSTTNLTSGNPTWTLETANIGDVTVTEIRQQTLADYHISNLGAIYAASYGRGLWMDTTYIAVGIDQGQGNNSALKGTIQISPNPVADYTKITFIAESTDILDLRVYDLTGREVKFTSLGSFAPGTHTFTANLADLSSGTYLVKVGNAYGKIVKR